VDIEKKGLYLFIEHNLRKESKQGWRVRWRRRKTKKNKKKGGNIKV
jgi:hypothetical protein